MDNVRLADRLAVKLATWRRLGRGDRALLISSILTIGLLRILIATVGFSRVHTTMSRALSKRTPSVTDASGHARVLEIARIVDAAARHSLVSNTCLHRALTLWWMLRRRGFYASVQLGVRKQSDHFEAHAWVTYAGAVVNDADVVDGDYVPLSLTPVRHRA